ncbi:MAG: hypothetical protein CMJ84_03260, partial [Planctomycetes bacterium]|nr:hypothetical protein [Planctomycetota bacterium]
NVGGVTIGENFSTISGWDVATTMLGMSGVKGFAGLGTPDFDDPDWAESDELFGLVMDGLDVGLGIMDSTFPVAIPGFEQFIGLNAIADNVSLATSGGDLMKLSANNAEIILNGNKSSWPGGIGTAVIDWAATDWGDGDTSAGLQVPTGAKNPDGSDVTVTLDMDGNARTKVSVDNALLSLMDFAQVVGNFAFEMGPRFDATVNLGDLATLTQYLPQEVLDVLPLNGSTMEMELETMTVGARDLGVFVGMGGYYEDTNEDGAYTVSETNEDDAVGIILDDIDFGLMLSKSSLPGLDKLLQFVTLNARAETAGFVGLGEEMAAEVRGIEVELNTGLIKGVPPQVMAVLNAPNINFKQSFETTAGANDGYYEVPTGTTTEPIRLEYDGELVRAAISQVYLDLGGFVFLSGSAALVKGPGHEVTLSDGSTKNVSIISLGLSDVNAFAGINGPYEDTNDNGVLDSGEDLNFDGQLNTGSMGLALEDVDAGILLMRSTDMVSDPGLYLAASLNISNVGLVGIPALELSVQARAELNIGIGAEGLAVVDFQQSFVGGEDLDQDGKLDTANEDVNKNGVLDPGEDLDDDGNLDWIEDVDGDGIIGNGFAVDTGGAPVLMNFDSFLYRVKMEGSLTIASAFTLDGDFLMSVTDQSLEVAVNASIDLDPLGTLTVSGYLEISDAGLVAAIQLTGAMGLGPVEIIGARQLEINTTSSSKTISRYEFDMATEQVTNVQVDVVLPAESLRIFVGGKLKAGDMVLQGTFELEENPEVFAISVDAEMDAVFTVLSVTGQVNIVKVANPGLVLDLEASVDSFGISGIFEMTADFRLQINTRSGGGSDQYDAGVARETYRVQVQNAELALLSVLEFNGSFTIEVVQGVFRMEGVVSTDFFGVATLEAEVFFSSEGEFDIQLTGAIDLWIDLEVAGIGLEGTIGGGISYLDGNGKDPFGDSNFVTSFGVFAQAAIKAEVGYTFTALGKDFYVGSGLFTLVEAEIALDYAGDTGEITLFVKAGKELGCGCAGLNLTKDVSVSHTFAIGAMPPATPPLPRYVAGNSDGSAFSGGVLHVFAGDLAHHREYAEDEKNETVWIVKGEEAYLVKLLGTIRHYPGATKIVVDVGDGNDSIVIEDGVDVPVEITGGDGDDVVYYEGLEPPTISGGPGNDLIELRNSDGDDLVNIGAIVNDGNYWIDGGAGDNTVVVRDRHFGSDTIHFTGINSTGNDISINHAEQHSGDTFDHKLVVPNHTLFFNNDIQTIKLSDSAALSRITSDESSINLQSVGLIFDGKQIELNKATAAASIELISSQGTLVLGQPLVTTAGGIGIHANGDIEQNGNFTTTNGPIDVQSTHGSITLADGVVSRVDVGDVEDPNSAPEADLGASYNAADSIEMSTLEAVGLSAVSVVANSGSIVLKNSITADYGKVTITAGGDVNFQQTVDVEGELSVDAGGDAVFQEVVSAASLSVTASAGKVDFDKQLDIGDWISVNAGTNIIADSAVNTDKLDASAGNDVTFVSALQFGSQGISVDAGGDANFPQAVDVEGSLSVDAGGDANFQQTVDVEGSLSVDAGGDANFPQTVDVGTIMEVTAHGLLVDKAVTAEGLVWDVVQDVDLNASPTVTGTMGVGNTGLLKIISQQAKIDFTGQDFHVVDGHLILSAQEGFTDTIRSEASALTAINRNNGDYADIVVREADGLVVLDHGMNSGGIYSQHGNIDLELAAVDALLQVDSGIISTDVSAGTIRLVADDINFISGENQVSGTGDLVIRSKHDNINYRIGTAGEQSGGNDLSDSGPDGYMDLSLRDMAAIADDFALVVIGHLQEFNTMQFGDIEDATEVKATGEERVNNGALRNLTRFHGDFMSIEGDIQAPVDQVEFYAHRVEVNSQNLHDPAGEPDSGVSARNIHFDVHEQMVVSGWIVGDDLVHMNLQWTAGIDPIVTYADNNVGPIYNSGPNSLTSDVGSLIKTGNDSSRVEIDASGSVRIAGVIKTGTGTPGDSGSTGDNSVIDVHAGSSITLLEGGLVYSRHAETQIHLDATTFLHVLPGSAVTAGADFDETSGEPVAYLTGNNANLNLSSTQELWIGGAVTASGSMGLAMDGVNHDFANYFDTIPGRQLFTVDATANKIAQLDAETTATGLGEAFDENGHTLSGVVTVQVVEAGARWRVIDEANQSYMVAVDANDASTLNITEPHYLDGHRNFSFLLTGTLTTLMPNADIAMAGADAMIVRGNINVLGQDASLSIQSDKWVYWEGQANVAGDLSIYGGVKIDGTDVGGANDRGASVYVHATSLLTTNQAGTSIDVRGSKDVDIFGAIVPGGEVGTSGVTFNGPDSTAHIEAGEQIYLDTGITAAKKVELVAGQAGADDNRISVLVNTVGGLTAVGDTSDGSGGLVSVTAGTDIWMMGHVTAGANVTQSFDDEGNLESQTYDWSDEPGTIRITAVGQALIGGTTTNEAGETVETGGYLTARDTIEIDGGANPDGRGVYVPAAGELVVHQPDGSISIDAAQDTEILGLLAAGGKVDTFYDGEGQYLGRKIQTFDGDSTVTVAADGKIVVGQDIVAGKTINLIGGGQGEAGKGMVLQGSVHMTTWRPDSAINVLGTGDIDILAPAHTNEIEADGFIATADGKLSGDVTLDIWLDKVDFEIAGQVTVTAAGAAGNTGIEDLVTQLQTALNTFEFTVTQSDNTAHPVDSTYTFDDPENPDIEVKLRSGRFMLVGPHSVKITTGSSNADLLGFDTSAADLSSSLPYTLLAPESGSVINLGSLTGPNGRLYIAGKIKAHTAINLYSAETDDGQNVDLDWTGLLETVDGPISLSPGGLEAVIKGDVIAGGGSNDVVVSAAHDLTLRGSLTAADDIIVTANTLNTKGTAVLSTGSSNSQILLTGTGNVSIDSRVGGQNPDLELVQIGSTAGVLTVEHASGWIETGALIRLTGHDVDVAGKLKSTRATAVADDYEVEIDIDGTVEIHGDIELAGSLSLKAGGDVVFYNTALAIDGSGQRLQITAGGDLRLGNTDPQAGQTEPMGVTVRADAAVTIYAYGIVNVAADASVQSMADDSTIAVDAGSVVLAGTVRAGGSLDGDGQFTWSGQRAAVLLETSGSIALGGEGLDEQGSLVSRGGTVEASGAVRLDAGWSVSGIGLSISPLSVVRADATGDGTWGDADDGLVQIDSEGDIHVYGFVDATDDGADATLRSERLLLVGGLVQSDDQLTLEGGTSDTTVGILVSPVVFDGNGDRVSGGTLDTSPGGDIALAAVDDILIQGVVGQFTESDGVFTADAASITLDSTAGTVTVSGQVDAADSVEAQGEAVNVLPGGRIKARAAGSELRLLARGTVYVGGGTSSADPAQVQGVSFTHLLAPTLRLDGMVSDDDPMGRVLLNAGQTTTVTGVVQSQNRIEANAGVDTVAWSLAELEGDLAIADLAEGTDIEISGQGRLSAANHVELNAGGDVLVDADSSVAGTRTVSEPVIVTTETNISVVVGSSEVAVGQIAVPQVHWIETTVTEQVGMEDVKVGSEYHTVDVTLEQIGYYNPDASSGAKTRQYFIEGIDYSYGGNGSGTSFGQLSDYQRTTYVLNPLGYKPLYDFTFANPTVNKTLNGVTSTSGWTPSWYEANDLWSQNNVSDAEPESGDTDDNIYLVDVSGWDDKYIRMPVGAQEDVLRVVSQGEPTVIGGKYVGRYRDSALAKYTQDKSSLTTATQTNFWADGNATVTDYDNSPARWDVDYYSSGNRLFEINDGHGGNIGRVPDWNYSSSSTAGYDTASRHALMPDGYHNDTASISGQYTLATHPGVHVGNDPHDDWYAESHSHPQTHEHAEEHTHTTVVDEGNEWVEISFTHKEVGAVYGSTLHGWEEFGSTVSITSNVSGLWTYTLETNLYSKGRWRVGDGTEEHWFGDDPYLDIWVEGFTLPDIDTETHTHWDAATDYSHIHGSVHGSSSTAEASHDTHTHARDQDHGQGAHGGHWTDKDLYETQYDYRYNWTGNWHDIYDTRQRFSYEWVSQEHDIWGKRPRYETYDAQTKVVEDKWITQWETQPVYGNEIRLVAEYGTLPGGQFAYGAFDSASITTGALTIGAGGDVTVSGLVTADAGNLEIDADGRLTVEGLVPAGADAGTLPSEARLTSAAAVTLSAGDQLTLADSAKVGSHETTETASVTLKAGGDLALGGEVAASDLVDVQAGRHVALSGKATVTAATAQLKVTAGVETLRDGGIGDITGDVQAALRADGSGGDIMLTAGGTGGDITLANSLLDADDQVSLTAAAGEVTHSGLVLADTLYGRAAGGFVVYAEDGSGNATANASVDTVDIQLTAGGDITLNNAKGLVLANVVAADGAITLGSHGDVTATTVVTQGTGDGNDITLATHKVNGSADLALHTVTAGGRGGVTLEVQGTVTTQTGGKLTAGALTVTAAGGVTLATDVTSLSTDTVTAGNVAVTQDATGLVLTRVRVVDGSFSLDAGGVVDLADVVLVTDDDENDITVTAVGDIHVQHASGGIYAARALSVSINDTHADDPNHSRTIDLSGVDVENGATYTVAVGSTKFDYPAPAEGTLTAAAIATGLASAIDGATGIAASASGGVITIASGAGTETISASTRWADGATSYSGITSHGDILLTSTGGWIGELSDAAVDLVADELTLSAATGITGLEIAANELVSVTTTAGDISLTEYDGAGESQPGLTVTAVSAGDGSVTISAEDALQAYRVVAGNDATGIVTLESRTGNLLVGEFDSDGTTLIKPTSLSGGQEALEYGYGVSLSAAEMLDTYMFFDADGHLEYRAGEAFNFDLPSSLSADTIILDLGPALKVQGTLTATDLVELSSDTNVYIVGGTIQSDGGGDVANMRVIARGTRDSTSAVYHEGTGLQIYEKISAPSTLIYVATTDDNGNPVGENAYKYHDIAWNYDSATQSSRWTRTEQSVTASDYQPKMETIPGGYIDIEETATFNADRLEIRALKKIDISKNTGFTLTGFIGGAEGTAPTAEGVGLAVEGDLDLAGAYITSSGTVDLDATKITSDAGSAVKAGTLQVDTETGIGSSTTPLNIVADTVNAAVSGTGGIYLKEADAVNLQSVVTENGDIEVFAGGQLTATKVQTAVVVDDHVNTSSYNNITLQAGTDLLVDLVQTDLIVGTGAPTSSATLEALGDISEVSPQDNDDDVIAGTITLNDQNSSVAGLETSGNSSTGQAD